MTPRPWLAGLASLLLLTGCAVPLPPSRPPGSTPTPVSTVGMTALEQARLGMEQVRAAAKGRRITTLEVSESAFLRSALGISGIRATVVDAQGHSVLLTFTPGRDVQASENDLASVPSDHEPDAALTDRQLDPAATLAFLDASAATLDCVEPDGRQADRHVRLQALPHNHDLAEVDCVQTGNGYQRSTGHYLDRRPLPRPQLGQTPEAMIAPVAQALASLTGDEQVVYALAAYYGTSPHVRVRGAREFGTRGDGGPCIPELIVFGDSRPIFACHALDRTPLTALAPGSTVLTRLGTKAGITDWTKPNWSLTGLVVNGAEQWAVEHDKLTTTYAIDGTQLSVEESKSLQSVPD